MKKMLKWMEKHENLLKFQKVKISSLEKEVRAILSNSLFSSCQLKLLLAGQPGQLLATLKFFPGFIF